MATKLFSWKDLKRVAIATLSDPLADLGELRDFLGILLFICASARRHIRSVQYLLEMDADQMRATYILLSESIAALGQATKIFPQAAIQEILDILKGIMGEIAPVTPLFPAEVLPNGENQDGQIPESGDSEDNSERS